MSDFAWERSNNSSGLMPYTMDPIDFTISGDNPIEHNQNKEVFALFLYDSNGKSILFTEWHPDEVNPLNKIYVNIAGVYPGSKVNILFKS